MCALDSLTAVGNLFQMVGAEKLKECPLKLIVHCRQEYIKDSDWLSKDSAMVGICVGF